MRHAASPVLAVALLAVTTSSPAASLPLPPPGFKWELDFSGSFSASDVFQVSLDVTQSLAPASPPVFTTLNESLTLGTFDASAEEAALEAAAPDSDYFVLVTSSIVFAELVGNGSVLLGNFDSAPHAYSGHVGLTDWVISGAASSGSPQSSSLTHVAGIALAGPSATAFLDETSGLSTAFQNLSAAASAPTTGGTVTVDFGGAFLLDVVSDAPASPTQMAIGVSSATGRASLATLYDAYQLVAVPEPSAGWLALAATCAGLSLRRGRSRHSTG